jgi:hypothetical protein
MVRTQKLAAVGLSATGMAGVLSGVAMIGSMVTLAKVLTLFFTGMGCGVSLVALIRNRKK